MEGLFNVPSGYWFFICAATLCGLALASWIYCNVITQCQLVPGPWGLPFIGNLPIFCSGTAHIKLTELANVYGPVFSIKLGCTDVLVLSSIDSVKEALIHGESDFSGRPSLYSILQLRHAGKSVAYMDYGSDYLRNKQATAAAMNILLYDKKNYEARVAKSVQNLTSSFMNYQDAEFDPQPLIKSAVAELMFRILFGDELPRHYVLEAQHIAGGLVNFTERSTVGNCVDFLFLLRWLSGDRIQRLDSSYMEVVKFVHRVHLARTAGNMHEPLQSTCIASILQDSRSRRNSLPLSQDNVPEQQELSTETIEYLLAEMFILGYEKISSAIAWMTVLLADTRQNIQQCLHRELDSLIPEENGSYFFLSLDDKTKLPILEATVLEVFRVACPFPFALPHCTTKDTVIANYKIPKDTVVFINLWACCHDSKYFENPNTFDPFRFLNESRNKLNKPFCVPSFSVGERRCFADGLAKGILFLLMGNLLHNFHFELAERVPVKEKLGLTLSPESYRLRAQPRNSPLAQGD